MSELVFPIALQEKISAQAVLAYPEECGGLLLGLIENNRLVVHEVIALANMKLESRHNRIEINPLDYAKAERYAIRLGLGVWGFYHSHPNAEAIPSEFDRTHFPFTNWWYPILSVKNSEVPKISSIRCWRLNESRENFSELIIHSN